MIREGKQWFAVVRGAFRYVAIFEEYEDAEGFRDRCNAPFVERKEKKPYRIFQVEGDLTLRLVAYEKDEDPDA